jgi:radical SAM protein with 4Fe4S-binding SPASM domain
MSKNHRRLLRNRLSLLKSYVAGDAVLKGRPTHIIIEGTAKCNLFCPMCPRELAYFPPKDMEMEIFQKVIEEGKDHLEFVVPFGGGEPLLGKDIFRMISMCREHGIRAWISTNGTVMDPKRARELLLSGLDYVIFAFDGATPEVYEKFRIGADFHRVRENILNFLKVKKELNSDIFTIVQMVRMKGNEHEVEAFKKLWTIEGIDEVRVKEDELREHNDALPAHYSGSFREACQILWRGPMYVRYDGETFPCCYAFRERSAGNIRQHSLAELWNSPLMVEMREAHHRGDLSAFPVCQTCQARQPKLPLVLGSFLVDSLRVRKAIPLFERLSAHYNISVFENG